VGWRSVFFVNVPVAVAARAGLFRLAIPQFG
jgi:hypothetical protein